MHIPYHSLSFFSYLLLSLSFSFCDPQLNNTGLREQKWHCRHQVFTAPPPSMVACEDPPSTLLLSSPPSSLVHSTFFFIPTTTTSLQHHPGFPCALLPNRPISVAIAGHPSFFFLFFFAF